MNLVDDQHRHNLWKKFKPLNNHELKNYKQIFECES